MPEVMQVTLVHCLLLFVLLWIICQVTFHISSQIFKIISRKNLSVMDQSLAVFLAVTGGRLYSFMFAVNCFNYCKAILVASRTLLIYLLQKKL